MNPRSRDTYTVAYNNWVQDQSPGNMAELVSAFMPLVNSELQQYSGPRELMRTRAKQYVVQAIRSFDPMSGAKLSSWVSSSLRQLSRYSKKLRPVHASEDMVRSAAELHRTTAELEDRLGRKPTDEELQDETGWTGKTLAKIRAAGVSTVNTGVMDTQVDTEGTPTDPGVSKTDQMPFYSDAIYASLNDRDKDVYDYKLGLHGREQLQGTDIAKRLGVSPAYVSQRSSAIGDLLAQLGGHR